MIPFAAYAAAETTNGISGSDYPKIALSVRDLDPSNTWYLGSTRVYPPIGIWISSAVFAGLKNVTNRQTDTDRPCYSVCGSRPHLAIAVMRLKRQLLTSYC